MIDVDQMHGIEIEEFPAQIAQVAPWLTDHQMNMQVSEEFGQYFRRLPLRKSPNIAHGNAADAGLADCRARGGLYFWQSAVYRQAVPER